MKILKLSFRNINSLAGSWSIDFTHPEFLQSGLFALTGATGAGKTSVLDAICLALYGETVREDISKEKNEVMTRGTGESSAEIEFSIGDRRYRSSWSQKRARGKADGALQQAERQIVDVGDNGTILAGTIKEAKEKIVQLTGMTFDQFTRSVLLAQGKFNAFLTAHVNDRAKILEQITRTEKFSQIGAAVFERFRSEKIRKEQLEGELQNVQLLSEEERRTAESQVQETRARVKVLQSELETIGKQIAWLDGLSQLERELADIVRQQEADAVLLAQQQPIFERLKQAEAARTCDAELADWKNRCGIQQEAVKAEEGRRIAAAEAQKRLQDVEPQLEQANQTAKAAQKELKDRLPIISKARALDQKIELAKNDCQGAETALKTALAQYDRAVKASAEAKQKLDKATADQLAAKKYLDTHAEDAALAERMTELSSLHATWLEQNQRRLEAKDALDTDEREAAKATIAVKQAQTAFTRAKKAVEKASAEEAKFDAELKRTETEVRKAQTANTKRKNELKTRKPQIEDAIEQRQKILNLAREVSSLKKHRENLKDGAPCPLCGATEHPFAKGNLPKTAKEEKEIKALKTELRNLESAAEDARNHAEAAVQKRDAAQTALQDAQKVLANAKQADALADQAAQTAVTQAKQKSATAVDAKKAAADAEGVVTKTWDKIFSVLFGLGEAHAKPEMWSAIEKRLNARQEDYEVQRRKESEAVIRIETARQQRGNASKAESENLQQFQNHQKSFEDKNSQLAELRNARIETFGTLNPGDEETRLREAEKTTEANRQTLNEAKVALKKEAETAAQEAVTALERVTRTAAEAKEAEAKAVERCCAAGFQDIATCLFARWTDAEVKDARRLREERERAKANLAGRNAAATERLAAARAEALTDRDNASLVADRDAKTAAKEVEDDALKQREFTLRADQEARASQAKKIAELTDQCKRVQSWERLNKLIGAADGKNFQKYAQGITLSHMLTAANPHLDAMSAGRYGLIWRPEDGDELLPVVIDRHQGDQVRPLSNFSGGETFMVSLALALGLSGMTAGRLRIDSLFLDEGFGTLDNDALELALGTLDRLHQTQGKLIGVISHLESLKSRIPTRIVVNKTGGGRSRLEGPGVTRLQPSQDAVTASPASPQRRGRPRKVRPAEAPENTP